MEHFVTASRVAVLAFSAAISIMPAAAAALPKYDRVVSYYDELGQTVGVRITNCLGHTSMVGQTTSIEVHITERCDAERMDPCAGWTPEIAAVFGFCPWT